LNRIEPALINTNNHQNLNDSHNKSPQKQTQVPSNVNVVHPTKDNFKEENTNINNMGMDQFKKEFEKISLKNNFDNFSGYNFNNKNENKYNYY
jgi:hypothetical protein